MDERGDLPVRQDGGTADGPVVVHRYRLSLETAVSVRSAGDAWIGEPERSAGGGVGTEDWVVAGEGDGAAQAFVDLLRYEDLPAVPGFRVLRLAPPPEATGERVVDVDLDGVVHATVVVGERVVVTWTRRTLDAPRPGVLTLQHLAAVDFLGVPDVYGILLWRTPGGHEVPVAVATRYLPRSRPGWEWSGELVEVAAGLRPTPLPVGTPPGGIDLTSLELPGRLGRLVAKLHLALATPSAVVPEPTDTAGPETLREWHEIGRADVAAVAGRLDAAELDNLSAAVDGVATLAERVAAGQETVVVQRIHGDLHVGRVLRWTSGGLAVVGFDAEPGPSGTRASADVGELNPAACDMARLVASLAKVARRADADPRVPDGVAWSWYQQARGQVLGAYRSVLAAEGRPDLLDETLLAAFEAQERARAVLAAEPDPAGAR